VCRSFPERTAGVVGLALELGYRHIDTAQSYGNEQGVGKAIAASGIPRNEQYVTSKLSNGNHRPDDVRRSFDETLKKLGLEELDLFLIHWPVPTLYDGDYVSTWKAMIELVKDGRVRTAGVSNFQVEHLERIVAATGVVPAVNQIEVHPYFSNEAVQAASIRHGVAVEAHSPLGHGQGRLLDEPVIRRDRRRARQDQRADRFSLASFRGAASCSRSRFTGSEWKRTLRSSASSSHPTRWLRSTASTGVRRDGLGGTRTRSRRSQSKDERVGAPGRT
jgi:diketogulonate reductase-like aldo/keto reductase